jgi:hypothetical protein
MSMEKLNYYGQGVAVRLTLRLNWLQVAVVVLEEEGQGKAEEACMMPEKRMRGHVELCCMLLLRGTCRLAKVWELSLLVVVGLGKREALGEEV